MTEEYWTLVDEHRNPTGVRYRRGDPAGLPPGQYHLAAEVWTLRQGQVLVTRRREDKPYGLLWEATGGGVAEGETTLQGALRELWEETGQRAAPEELHWVGEIRGSNWILDVYVYPKGADAAQLRFQAEEVLEGRYVTPETLTEMHDRGQLVESVWQRWLRLGEKILRIGQS